jgi:hypothetical protein
VASQARLLSEVRFASFLVYSPRGLSESSIRSRHIRDRVKNDHAGDIAQIAARIVHDGNPCAPVIGPGVLLVPAPRSSPLVAGALWPARRIAEELVVVGLGDQVIPLVLRAQAVQKSAFATPGNRPTPQQHLDSFVFDRQLINPERVTVVDDFVTKGATLLAAASLVKHHFPDSEVCAFALIRTMGLQADVEQLVAPCVGTVTLTANGAADRQP